MAQQLEETKKDRELMNQPLPWIVELKVCIEKPRFYYAPPEDEYFAHPRFWVYFKLKNAGAHPAVTIDISAVIIVQEGETPIEHKSASIRIETLEEKQIYPYEKDGKENIIFQDESGTLLRALRENNLQKFPKLQLRILYRNILGGCFMITTRYILYPKNEDQDSILNNWLSEVTSFKIKFKNDLDNLLELRESNPVKWEKLFDKVKRELAQSLIGEDKTENNELDPWPVPGSFEVTAISDEQYKETTKDIFYGIKIPFKSLKSPCITN